MNDTVYSVSQLNREARLLLGGHFVNLQVEGEVSNFTAASSGHWYFTLKDDQAQIRCAYFKNSQHRAAVRPKNGDQVLLKAQVSLYEPRGDYQLIVERLEAAGEGALRLAFEQLKAKLQAEGLFDSLRKRELPLIPKQIGVITSPKGAALHDVLTVLQRRFPAIPVVIYPVAVQGEAAKFEIAQAIKQANQRAEVEVLIVGRGGGSLEDLWAFNEEIVARAIADSAIPIVSAVGHEVDFSIADFVADLRAATPSAAAELVVPRQQDWLSGFVQLEQQLLQVLRRQLLQQRQRLEWLDKSLQRLHPGQQLQRNAQRLDELQQRLQQSWQIKQDRQQQRLALASQKLNHLQPQQRIAQSQQKMDYLQQRLQRAIELKLSRLRQQQTAIHQTLHAISPLATLERGYAIVHDQQGRVVKSIGTLKAQDTLETRLADGRVLSRVEQLLES